MSKREGETELPRDAHVVHALRRELNRNTRRISQTFWQEFESIRNQQRDQLEHERRSRERITTLMRDSNLEAQQQLEALSRSISSHGINPAAPSPRMQREVPAIMPATPEKSPAETQKITQLQLKQKRPSSTTILRRRPPPASGLKFSTTTPRLYRPTPSTRATAVAKSVTPQLKSTRTTPKASKTRLTIKPKM